MAIPISAKHSILIVGGGIGGLTAAIFLGQAGHTVTILGHKLCYTDEWASTHRQGLSLTFNATRYFHKLGMGEDFLAIADIGRELQIKSYSDGSSIKRVQTPHSHAVVHRADLVRVLFKHAIKAGAKVLHQSARGFAEHQTGVSVLLEDRTCLQADVVIGADGIHSLVRSCIGGLNKVQPVFTGHCTFLIDVSKSAMAQNTSTFQLYEDGKHPYQFWIGPERSIVGWTMTKSERYHLQMNDHAYGQGAMYGEDTTTELGFVTDFTDMERYRQRWSDFEPAIEQLLQAVGRCKKWRIAELPELPSWASAAGRIILLGDAAHAVPPFSGQGAAMAIEDAAALATLLSGSHSISGFDNLAKAYERLRRPRVQGVREITHLNMELWGMSNAEEQVQQYQHQIHGVEGAETTNGTGAWTTEQRYRWINSYDAVTEAEKVLRECAFVTPRPPMHSD